MQMRPLLVCHLLPIMVVVVYVWLQYMRIYEGVNCSGLSLQCKLGCTKSRCGGHHIMQEYIEVFPHGIELLVRSYEASSIVYV